MTGLRRRVIEIDGLGHRQPIPLAVELGGFVVTGSVNGVDRASGDLPDDIAEEVENAFDNLGTVLAEAGASYDSLLKLDVLLRTTSAREHINDSWIARFPDSDDRPVRHVTIAELPASFNIQLLAFAVAAAPSSTEG